MEELQQQLLDETDAKVSTQTECFESDCASPQTAVAPVLDRAYEQRRSRILGYRVEAQDDPNTLLACLAGVNSDLFDCELHVGETYRQGIAESCMSIDDVQRHSALIELMLRLSRQIAQLSQIELNVRKKEELTAAASEGPTTKANKSHFCAPTDE